MAKLEKLQINENIQLNISDCIKNVNSFYARSVQMI